MSQNNPYILYKDYPYRKTLYLTVHARQRLAALGFAPDHLICGLKCTESVPKMGEMRRSWLRCCA
jgi:hypothetical protein